MDDGQSRGFVKSAVAGKFVLIDGPIPSHLRSGFRPCHGITWLDYIHIDEQTIFDGEFVAEVANGHDCNSIVDDVQLPARGEAWVEDDFASDQFSFNGIGETAIGVIVRTHLGGSVLTTNVGLKRDHAIVRRDRFIETVPNPGDLKRFTCDHVDGHQRLFTAKVLAIAHRDPQTCDIRKRVVKANVAGQQVS